MATLKSSHHDQNGILEFRFEGQPADQDILDACQAMGVDARIGYRREIKALSPVYVPKVVGASVITPQFYGATVTPLNNRNDVGVPSDRTPKDSPKS
jgi:hypothetical protein